MDRLSASNDKYSAKERVKGNSTYIKALHVENEDTKALRSYKTERNEGNYKSTRLQPQSMSDMSDINDEDGVPRQQSAFFAKEEAPDEESKVEVVPNAIISENLFFNTLLKLNNKSRKNTLKPK